MGRANEATSRPVDPRVPTRVWETRIHCTVEALFDFHRSAEALTLLTPPNRQVQIVGDAEVRNGALHVLRIRQFGLPMEWHARISQVDPPNGFTDTAERSPFAYWQHHHRFIPEGSGAILRDEVTYRMPLGPLGQIADRLFVARDLDRLFAFRHAQTKRALEAQGLAAKNG